MYGPVIKGELVRLRPPREEESETMMSWMEDLEVTWGILVRFPSSLEQQKDWLRRMAEDRNHILWAIEHEGRLVGTTGIHGIDWENGWGTTGTLIGDKKAWRKGLATELMRIRADYAFTNLPLRKLKSGHIDGNTGSARAQAAAGYKVVGRHKAERFRDGRWFDMIDTELMREDWEAARGSRESI